MTAALCTLALAATFSFFLGAPLCLHSVVFCFVSDPSLGVATGVKCEYEFVLKEGKRTSPRVIVGASAAPATGAPGGRGRGAGPYSAPAGLASGAPRQHYPAPNEAPRGPPARRDNRPDPRGGCQFSSILTPHGRGGHATIYAGSGFTTLALRLSAAPSQNTHAHPGTRTQAQALAVRPPAPPALPARCHDYAAGFDSRLVMHWLRGLFGPALFVFRPLCLFPHVALLPLASSTRLHSFTLYYYLLTLYSLSYSLTLLLSLTYYLLPLMIS